MNPTTNCLLRHKVLDSKMGVRADQFRNPSFVLSLDGPPWKTSGRVWPVRWLVGEFSVRVRRQRTECPRVVRRQSFAWRIT